MTEPYIDWDYDPDRRTIKVWIDPNDDWREIVYGNRAHVTLFRGCPHCGLEDHITAIEIRWDEDPVNSTDGEVT